MDEQNRIFILNLKYYLSLNKKNQKEVAEAIGVPVSTFSTWMVGKAMPRMGKLQALAMYFNCNVSDLIEEKTTDALFLSKEEKILIEINRSNNPAYSSIIGMMISNYEKEGGLNGNSKEN